MKIIISIIAALFLLTGAYSFAKAECEMPMTGIEQLVKETPETKLVELTEQQAKTFIEAVGTPPNTDTAQPFTLKLLVHNPSGLARLLVVQNGCVTTNAGPAPLEVFLRKVGIVEANG